MVALEAEPLAGVCYSFSLGTWGIGTKGKRGKEEEKAEGVSQCTSKSWQKRLRGRQPHCIHSPLRPAATALALSAVRDALDDDFFVLLIFSISFKICCSVFYCKVSPLCSGNCHFKQKQPKVFHRSNKKTRLSISLKCSPRALTEERLIYLPRRIPLSVHGSGARLQLQSCGGARCSPETPTSLN